MGQVRAGGGAWCVALIVVFILIIATIIIVLIMIIIIVVATTTIVTPTQLTRAQHVPSPRQFSRAGAGVGDDAQGVCVCV